MDDQAKGKPPEALVFPLRIVAVLAVLILTIVAGSAAIHQHLHRHMKREALNQLTVIAALKVGQIREWRQDMLLYGILFRESTLLQDELAEWSEIRQPEVNARTRQHFSVMQTYYPYHDILLADAEGRIVASLSDTARTMPEDVMPDFRSALATRNTVLTDLYQSQEYGIPALSVIAPLFDAEKAESKPYGALVLVIDPADYLYPLIEAWPTASDSAETLLVRRDGDNVLFLNALRFGKDAALRMKIPLTRQDVPSVMGILGKRGIVSGNDYRGEKVLAAIAAVPNSPWLMVSKMDEAEIFAPMHMLLGGIIVLVILLVGVAGSLSVIYWQRLQRQHYRIILDREIAQRAAEQKLNASNEYAANLIRTSNAIIIGMDSEGRVTTFNAMAEEITGYSCEELLGRNWFDVIVPRARYPQVRAEFERLMEGGVPERFENPILCKSGEERYIVWRNSPLLEDGKITSVIAFGIDITERKKAEDALKTSNEQLNAANRTKADFFARMSHELRTPLNAVIGFAEIIQNGMFGPQSPKYPEYAGDIRSSAEYLLSLINDILDMSKMEARKFVISKEPMGPSPLIRECADIVAITAAKKKIAIVLDVPPDMQEIAADRRALKQVLLNLLSNAIKAMPRNGGQIGIAAWKTENPSVLHIDVRDTGEGIPPDMLDKVFEPFGRGNSMVVARTYGSTGLGLSISRNLMEMHGGTLTLESEVDHGTTAHMTLPV